jgi:hypothetical protein
MSDRRGERRKRAVRLVQVAHDGEAAYARCRELSDGGMKLDLTAPLELNDHVTVALSPSIVLTGTVAWINGRECGIAFDEAVDSVALLAASAPSPRAGRSPATGEILAARQAPHRPARNETRSEPNEEAGFRPGLAVTVMLGPNREERCLVRWAKGNVTALERPDCVETQQPQQLLLPGSDTN